MDKESQFSKFEVGHLPLVLGCLGLGLVEGHLRILRDGDHHFGDEILHVICSSFPHFYHLKKYPRCCCSKRCFHLIVVGVDASSVLDNAHIGDEAARKDFHATVVRCDRLRDGAHAHAVHPKLPEHLQLCHCLVVGSSNHSIHTLMGGNLTSERGHLTNNPLQIKLLCNTPGHFAVVSVIDVVAGEEAGTKSVVVGSSQGVLHTSAQLILRDKQ